VPRRSRTVISPLDSLSELLQTEKLGFIKMYLLCASHLLQSLSIVRISASRMLTLSDYVAVMTVLATETQLHVESGSC
jgi:hypothetical protein